MSVSVEVDSSYSGSGESEPRDGRSLGSENTWSSVESVSASDVEIFATSPPPDSSPISAVRSGEKARCGSLSPTRVSPSVINVDKPTSVDTSSETDPAASSECVPPRPSLKTRMMEDPTGVMPAASSRPRCAARPPLSLDEGGSSPARAPADSSRFQRPLNAKNLCLTYDHCTLPKERLMEGLRECFGAKGVECVLVGRELHQDGSPHLHALVCLSKKVYTRNARFADIDGFHGNYLGEKYGTPWKWAQYCKKEGDYCAWPADSAVPQPPPPRSRGAGARSASTAPDGEPRPKKQKISDIVAQKLLEGETLGTLMRNDATKGFFLMNHSKMMSFQRCRYSILASEAPLIAQPPWAAHFATTAHLMPQHAAARSVRIWMEANVKTGTPRPLRTPQLWISGRPACGKTTFVEQCRKYLRVYTPSVRGGYWDGYSDEEYDLIVIDDYEFDGRQYTVDPEVLLHVLCGDSMRLHCRYADALKCKNLPVIVTSMSSIEEVFRFHVNSEKMIEAMQTRVRDVKVPACEMLSVFDLNV